MSKSLNYYNYYTYIENSRATKNRITNENDLQNQEKACLQKFLVIENSISNMLQEMNGEKVIGSIVPGSMNRRQKPILSSENVCCLFGWSETEVDCEICNPNFKQLLLFRRMRYERKHDNSSKFERSRATSQSSSRMGSGSRNLSSRNLSSSRSSLMGSNRSIDRISNISSSRSSRNSSRPHVPDYLSTVHEDIGCLLIETRWVNGSIEEISTIENRARQFGELVPNETFLLQYTQNHIVIKFRQPAKAMLMLRELSAEKKVSGENYHLSPYSSKSNFNELLTTRNFSYEEKDYVLHLNFSSQKYIDWEEHGKIEEIKSKLKHLFQLFGIIKGIQMEKPNEYSTIFDVCFMHKQSIDLIKDFRGAYHDKTDNGKFKIGHMSFVPIDDTDILRNQ